MLNSAREGRIGSVVEERGPFVDGPRGSWVRVRAVVVLEVWRRLLCFPVPVQGFLGSLCHKHDIILISHSSLAFSNWTLFFIFLANEDIFYPWISVFQTSLVLELTRAAC